MITNCAFSYHTHALFDAIPRITCEHGTNVKHQHHPYKKKTQQYICTMCELMFNTVMVMTCHSSVVTANFRGLIVNATTTTSLKYISIGENYAGAPSSFRRQLLISHDPVPAARLVDIDGFGPLLALFSSNC